MALADRDPEKTAAAFTHWKDGAAYLAILQRLLDSADAIGGFPGSKPRSPQVLRYTVTSGRSCCRREFHGDEADLLWVPWLPHAGAARPRLPRAHGPDPGRDRARLRPAVGGGRGRSLRGRVPGDDHPGRITDLQPDFGEVSERAWTAATL
ncbi:hypothetical protein GCM10011578_036030 [Streptomyces fuscichromogenes]|uniref:Uncharacterized protein n=1 Tax=Streptomyces fuscichromogenes TaxID=1324013 RepID=A0A917XCQ5_9ACTN|nr:hypothetical protein GCM10011578_036030 [Streptomyces fuscichromogenes]